MSHNSKPSLVRTGWLICVFLLMGYMTMYSFNRLSQFPFPMFITFEDLGNPRQWAEVLKTDISILWTIILCKLISEKF